MICNSGIIQSILDNDLYTATVGELVFHLFSRAKARYKFINRNNIPFPKEFVERYRAEILKMKSLALTDEEEAWMKRIPFLRPTYVEWLKGYRFDPAEVTINQDERGFLTEEIYAPWYRSIWWEVPLLAIKSELYNKMMGNRVCDDWSNRAAKKGYELEKAGCYWIDFGTRRRFSFNVQDGVVFQMKKRQGFLGTSNMLLAMRHNVNAHGTYSHQGPMGVSALYGVRMANKMWMKHWSEHFEGNVGVALTDTFTSEVFWRDFGTYEARLFDGCRQDSGDPFEWGIRMVDHYRKLGIPMSNKRMVFSDNLTTDKYIEINNYFKKFGQPVGGIGTHFSNDVGIKPLNMVIKMVAADFGHGEVPVIKLSDDPMKHTGDTEMITQIQKELNINE